ncbi:hypothetical protein AgCh_019155 [Apium graveolens]
MNRGTRRVEFIEKQKDRALSFMKRRSGLVNKTHELSTVWGVDACVIIKAPKDIRNNGEPVDLAWSSSSDSEKRKAESKLAGLKNVENCEGSSCYVEKKREAERMLAGLKKESCEGSKLMTWNSMLESMKERELRDLANDLEIKISNVKRLRDLMKSKRIKRVINTNPNGDDNYLEMVRNQVKMGMISLEDKGNYRNQARIDGKMKMAMNTIEDQPIAMMKPDVVSPIVARTEQDYAYRNSQMEIRVSRQSYYRSSLPPLPPLMPDHSTNRRVSSQMQHSGQLGTLFKFQAQDTDRHCMKYQDEMIGGKEKKSKRSMREEEIGGKNEGLLLAKGSSSKGTGNKVQCNHCHKMGHEEKDCWYKGKPQCYKCKKYGHLAKNCRFQNDEERMAQLIDGEPLL